MKKNPLVSVIIPAANEEAYLERAINSIRAQTYECEVIAVVNGSTDGTSKIANKYSDKVIENKKLLGSSRARNEGAEIANGDYLIFLDADSFLETTDVIENIIIKCSDLSFGTVLGKPDSYRAKYRVFFLLKNLWHLFGLYKGTLGGLLFCSKKLFTKINGFNSYMKVDELHDFSVRARKAGGEYKLISSCYSITSMRRFEKNGLTLMFIYWIWIYISRIFRKKEVFKDYIE